MGRLWGNYRVSGGGTPGRSGRSQRHDLRHRAASLAIANGASVKAVQRMLGHASGPMTLDIYAGLFRDDLDGVAVALDDLVPQRRATSGLRRCGHDGDGGYRSSAHPRRHLVGRDGLAPTTDGL
jgi:hypothetical protein